MTDKCREEFEKFYFRGCDSPIELQRDGENYTTMSAMTAFASWEAAYSLREQEILLLKNFAEELSVGVDELQKDKTDAYSKLEIYHEEVQRLREALNITHNELIGLCNGIDAHNCVEPVIGQINGIRIRVKQALKK